MVPYLVHGRYQPSPEVFDAIVDGRPWWGMYGAAIWGPGPKSCEGPAEESRFLLNPFMLVAANPASAEIWDTDKITDEDWQNPDFPTFWNPSSLRWWPKECQGQVVYNVSGFNDQLNRWRSKLKKEIIVPWFSLVAYNARDFGFNWIYLDGQRSQHIKNTGDDREAATQLVQMIHCGDSCQIPGGCNNMSPATKAIDEIKYTELPARAYVSLWREKPNSVEDRADAVFILDLQ